LLAAIEPKNRKFFLKNAMDHGKDLPKGEMEFFTGAIYLSGLGVMKNTLETIRLWILAAEKGCIRALYFLAELYMTGDSLIEKDMKKGIQLLEHAAEKHYIPAMYKLGKMYCKGNLHMKRNISKGVSLLSKAADSGDSKSIFLLGRMYFYGKDLQQDKSKAISFFKRGAEKGDINSAMFLYLFYGQRLNGEDNPAMAEKYYKLILALEN
jgi:hypothetical protein